MLFIFLSGYGVTDPSPKHLIQLLVDLLYRGCNWGGHDGRVCLSLTLKTISVPGRCRAILLEQASRIYCMLWLADGDMASWEVLRLDPPWAGQRSRHG